MIDRPKMTDRLPDAPYIREAAIYGGRKPPKMYIEDEMADDEDLITETIDIMREQEGRREKDDQKTR